MKQKKKLFYLFLCVYLFVNCTSKETTTFVNNKVIEKDTVYINTGSPISDDLYFSINKISIGDYWEKNDESDCFYYYRLLLTSLEERHSIYVEEIKIIDDSKVEMVKRFEIKPDIFGEVYYSEPPDIVNWLSPTVVKLLINEKELDLDIKDVNK